MLKKQLFQQLFLFTLASFIFSLYGALIDSSHSFILGTPIEHNAITPTHVLGHIAFGSIIGIVTLCRRYIILGGSFAILLDADHILQFFNIELISRMSHSLLFAIMISIFFYFVFRKTGLILASISFSAILSHISFDIFLVNSVFPNSSTEFPLFSPILLNQFSFKGETWIYFEIAAILVVFICTIIKRKLL